jgi:hypothetical protein
MKPMPREPPVTTAFLPRIEKRSLIRASRVGDREQVAARPAVGARCVVAMSRTWWTARQAGPLLAAAVLVGACGGSTPAHSVGVCALLTTAEVQATLGDEEPATVQARPVRPVTPGGLLDGQNASECDFDAVGPGDARSVALTLERADHDWQAQLTFAELSREAGNRPVDGIGDQAFQDDTRLILRRGAALLEVVYGGSEGDPGRVAAALRRLGRSAAARL